MTPLIGRPTHYQGPHGSTACGLVGPFTKTPDPKRVTCLRCRGTRAFQELRRPEAPPVHPLKDRRESCPHARSRPQEGTALHTCEDCGADVVPPGY